ncbi:sigma-70 family RNA polymerase sigma factor [Nocardioides sp.]|uniref:RNA polymerase sigma factor n=1 Tax=Nocardioides sp. TaxID=35761 RepID=UPI002638DEBA|nr:sigma-70 family RNA polymerase sigma factor [Nocardioides sp.]MDI6910021.1 sigma-70 family RNA polymerase sigma factor [Nocardioides sp.]
MDFQDLLRDARLGEGTAFAELWSRHATRVAGFVRVRGATDVEEITSDVFVAAFEGIGRFEGDEAGFVALLLTIARRRVVDEQRRRSRRVPVAPWEAEDDVRTVRSVEDDVLDRATADDLADHLGRLTPEQREVVTLRLLTDLSLEQTAQVMGKRVGTVKSLQRRALDALRRSLAGEPDNRHSSSHSEATS